MRKGIKKWVIKKWGPKLETKWNSKGQNKKKCKW
jgi:hypothetical protein